MSHPEQQQFCEGVKRRYPHHFTGKRVLDVGSLDVNGSNKTLFANCDYIGCDYVGGRNVDFIGKPEDIPGDFDVVISTEALEHDPEWKNTLLVMARKTKPGGLMLFTCGGVGRPEHGTRKHPVKGMVCTSDYYGNLNAIDTLRVLSVFTWRWHEIVTNNVNCDLYFFGIRA